MNGSELLLQNAERYGLVLARAVEETRRLSRPNIGMTIVHSSSAFLDDKFVF